MSTTTFSDTVQSFSIKELADSEIEISGDIPQVIIAPYIEEALHDFIKRIDLPGFRKGHVPSDMVRKKVGEVALLEEAVTLCMKQLYPALVQEKNIDAVGQPAIRITKLAPDNPVGVTIRAAVYPEVTLPKNWQELGVSVALVEPGIASEKEVEDTIISLQQSRKIKKDDGTESVPEINDDFAKSLGAFENLDTLKTEITKGINEEKIRAAKDTRRGTIIDALLDKTKVVVPTLFVESELDKIIAQLREDLEKMNTTFDTYLERMKKTETDLRNEFREQAHKRAKLQLTLNKIADVAHIEPDKEAIEKELSHAMEHFPDAKEHLVRIHIDTVLRNEKVLQLLEEKTKKE